MLSFSRLRTCLFAVPVAVALLLTGFPPETSRLDGIGEAQAQQQQPRRRTLLELLKGNQQQQVAPQVKKAPKRATRRTTKTRKTSRRSNRTVKRTVTTSAPRAPAVAESETVEKLDSARTVLVVGDFIAGGLAQGLEEAFADVAGVRIVSRANGSSGFVRDDFYDWPASVGAIIEEVSPAVVVVMIGSNDRQAMRVGGRSEEVRTGAWDREYISRVNSFAAAVQATNTPLVWVGGPPFRFKSMSADILAFNEFYRDAATAVGGTFVDIWDGFVDEDGAFVASGSGVSGQTVRLRASDGINFTKDGKRKLAFYVERQIRQMLGDAASPLLTTLAPESFSTMRLPPLQPETDLVRINPIPLTDPELDGGAALLGDITRREREAGNNPLQAKSIRRKLVQDGVPPPPMPGRANDFTWPEDEPQAEPVEPS
ncbi:SGNH/GDSL hydrolase family protein [Oricola cellulosilytica]|uniref:SGNH/GDSL hydrolase family protein n=1 Tax=Oricola cellulosilytica TaxID=1429082 RepID=UPI00130486A7|nr:DUF459 domain-containing protein [Oricola cellulosilytica]